MLELIRLRVTKESQYVSGRRKHVQKVWEADGGLMIGCELACSCHRPFKFVALKSIFLNFLIFDTTENYFPAISDCFFNEPYICFNMVKVN